VITWLKSQKKEDFEGKVKVLRQTENGKKEI
jgi:glycine cleavage system aminomethyltransferase T